MSKFLLSLSFAYLANSATICSDNACCDTSSGNDEFAEECLGKGRCGWDKTSLKCSYIPSTTVTPIVSTKKVGEKCYCSPYSDSTTTLPPCSGMGCPKPSYGFGDCECVKLDGYGQNSITVMYTGTTVADKIEWYQNGVGSTIVCTDTNVAPGQEVTCNIMDYNNGEFKDFETNTYFKITSSGYSSSNNECVGSFHTSCSRDIVGTIAENGCTDMICTAWGQYNTAYGECTDGFTECDCDLLPSTTQQPTTTVDEGDKQCYCQYATRPTTTTAAPCSGMGCPKDSGGLGFGDCICDKDYGQTTLTMRYEGTVIASKIDFYYNGEGSDIICSFANVNPLDRITCDITKFQNGKYTDFGTNTYYTIYSNTYGSGGSCYGSFHTSCSRDIVLTRGETCPELLCTAWTDGNPNTGSCDDGFVPCACTTTVAPETTSTKVTTTPTPVICDGIFDIEQCMATNGCKVEDFDVDEINCIPDQSTTTSSTTTKTPEIIQTTKYNNYCYCKTESGPGNDLSDGLDINRRRLGMGMGGKKSGMGMGRKKDTSNGNGVGDCVCDKSYGQTYIGVIYLGTSVATQIDWHYDGYNSPIICRNLNVNPGQQIDCNITKYDKSLDFKANTYFKITDVTGQTCMGSFHTSCSRDIIGYRSENGCDKLLCNIWYDGNPTTGACTDGYTPCDCNTLEGESLKLAELRSHTVTVNESGVKQLSFNIVFIVISVIVLFIV